MSQGEELHISTWLAIWPTRVSKLHNEQESSTKSSKGASLVAEKDANYDNVTANRIRGAAHYFEAKCFGFLCASFLDSTCIDVLSSRSADPKWMREALKASPQSPSMFLGPTGALLPGFAIDPETGTSQTVELLQHQPGMLYGDIDLDDCIEGEQYHDVTGGCPRLNVFDFKVDRTRREPASFLWWGHETLNK